MVEKSIIILIHNEQGTRIERGVRKGQIQNTVPESRTG